MIIQACVRVAEDLTERREESGATYDEARERLTASLTSGESLVWLRVLQKDEL